MKKLKTFYFILLTSCLSILFTGCSGSNDDEREKPLNTYDEDLPGILKRGKLVVLAENSSTSFFIYRGKKMGFEYEILKEFAEDLGVTLEVKVIDDLDKIEEDLSEGVGEIVACNYAITRERQDSVEFSIPYYQTNQVLIQRKQQFDEKTGKALAPESFITDPIQLAKKKVYVWDKSSYFDRLLNLQDEIGDTIFIRPTQSYQGVEELIEMVADGQIDYTVAEKNTALINEQFYDNIDASVSMSFKQNIGFGFSKKSPLLKRRLDAWLKKFMQREAFAYIKGKYYDFSGNNIAFTDESFKNKKGSVSPFDAIIKREAAKHGLDWRFALAIICHESSFNPNARGLGGAYGLMQFMPGTGPNYGVYPTSTPEVQIKGGMKFIAKMDKLWGGITDPNERRKFILASYNAGVNHVHDAQKLAQKRNLNPQKWEGNVGEMMLNLGKHEFYSDPVVKAGALRGTRTYKYVIKVMSRYENYKNLVR